jgi:glycosyltransferase involved in cell wall biosynthesis
LKILFVTWDGPQVTYLETLFLPIFKRLESFGIEFYVFQFTWADTARIAQTRLHCEAVGIKYRPYKVMRQPKSLGAFLSALLGGFLIRKLVRNWSIDVLMPRSNLPALASLVALRGVRLPVVFDADGLPLDERVEFAGDPPGGFSQRFLRDIEAEMVRRADRVLTRSERATEILFARGGAGIAKDKFHVVRNGRDATTFSPGSEASRQATRQDLGIALAAPLLVYAGSLGEQYCVREMLQLFEAVKRRHANARFLILSGSPELARVALAEQPALVGATVVKSVPADEVPRYLACADLGLALRRHSFSMQAVAPIKIGEYLLCGLPVVATRGVGDTKIIGEDAGFLVELMDQAELECVAAWFCDRVVSGRGGFASACRKVGTDYFSLDSCTADYLTAFQGLGPAAFSRAIPPVDAPVLYR